MDLLCAGRQRPAGRCGLCTGEALCLSDRSIACICVPIYPIGIVTNTTVWHIKAGPLV